jgi:hypothetical protein
LLFYYSLFLEDDSTSKSSVHKLVPALGEQFSHGITNRLLLHYERSARGSAGGGGGGNPNNNPSSVSIERKASLIKSPSMPMKTVSFLINLKGIRDLPLPPPPPITATTNQVRERTRQISCPFSLFVVSPPFLFLFSLELNRWREKTTSFLKTTTLDKIRTETEKETETERGELRCSCLFQFISICK